MPYRYSKSKQCRVWSPPGERRPLISRQDYHNMKHLRAIQAEGAPFSVWEADGLSGVARGKAPAMVPGPEDLPF